MQPESELQLTTPERVIGRYAIYDEIASGGMAVVHLGRMLGQAGFSRTVAIKRLHPQFAKDRNFVAMFLDEARLSVRVQHPNVVAPLDVLVADGEVLVVMEYVAGDTLSRLQRSQEAKEHPPSPSIVVAIMTNTLYGLHAAHEAVGEDGTSLFIVHRDVSPQNIMVGTNGIARVLDFGVAKATVRSHCTANGEVKGKLAYMAPEQIEGKSLDRRTDIFAAGVVAWESLTRRRLFSADEAAETIARILRGRVPSIAKYAKDVPPGLDEAVRKAIHPNPAERFQTAREFAIALERACTPASPSEVGDWVKSVGGDDLVVRAERVAAIETKSSSSLIRPLQPPPRISEAIPIHVPPPRASSPQLTQSHSRVTVQLANDALPSQPTELVSLGKAPQPTSQRHALRINRKLLIACGIGFAFVGMASVLIPRLIRADAKPVQAIPSAAGEVRTPPAPPAANVQPAANTPVAASATPTTPSPDGRTADPSVTTDDSPKSASSANREGAARRPASARAHSSKPVPAVGSPATETSKAKANCNPPYYVDSSGIRRLRPECL